MTDRELVGGAPVVAGVAGSIVLAMTGAPQSISMVFVVGPDSPPMIAAQAVYAVLGAAGMAAAVLLDRFWPWLLTIGAAAVVVATAVHAPKYTGITASVGSSTEPVDVLPVAVGCVLSFAAGLLVVALFAAARPRPVVAVVAIAAYFGVALIGPLRAAEPTPRALIVAAAALIAVVAAFLSRASVPALNRNARTAAVVAAAATTLPTLLVAVTGKQGFATVAGGVVGVIVLAVALTASARAGALPSVASAAAVLAAPVIPLFMLFDAPVTGEWPWLVAFGGAAAGAVAALSRWSTVTVVALSVVPMALMATRLGGRDVAEFALWAAMFLSIAAAAATVGSLSRTAAGTAFVPLTIAATVGVFGALNLWRSTFDRMIESAGQPSHWAAALLLTAATLHMALRKQ